MSNAVSAPACATLVVAPKAGVNGVGPQAPPAPSASTVNEAVGVAGAPPR